MKTTFDCLSCLVRQAFDGIQRAIDDPDEQLEASRIVLKKLASLDFNASPPELAGLLQEVLKEISHKEDIYCEEKAKFTSSALDMLPALEKAVEESADPFMTAVKLAVAGNIIDFGASSTVTEEEVRTVIGEAMKTELCGVPEEFREACRNANRILYLLDNAGETVLDRLLIERLPKGKIMLAARGTPVLNDATVEDARAAGLHLLAPVISNGSSLPGTVPMLCSDEFRQHFSSADLIISKGQGNYETLRESRRPVFFLFRIKCDLVARNCGLPEGSNAVLRPTPKLKTF